MTLRILLLAACLAVGSCGNPAEPSYPVFQVTRATIGWIQLPVLAPNDQLSNRVTWDVTCT
jgi:hypothetical protein